MKYRLLLLSLVFSFAGWSQAQDITESLYETYEKYKESSLDKRRIKHHQLQPLVNMYDAKADFTVKVVGRSIEGRALNLFSIGNGETDVFLWSQMHGNEPTATQAIFDIFNFLASDDFKKEKADILSNLTLHFLPMLNPDGAERFQRRNMLGVDINRDALRLQSPESQTLKRVRDSVEADFGFNLHDQSTYYNAERTDKPATISYLAPAYNYEKEINEKRGNAMKIIVFMNNIVQKYAPGQVGRYNDDFEPRAFGDNIQKWGTSTILIESGGYANDVEKQEIRKLNYVSILSAIYTIAKGNYKDIPLEDYEKIPENDRKLFDLKVVNANYELLGYGYETFDATGYSIKEGRVYTETLNGIEQIDDLTRNVISLLKSGYTYVRMSSIPAQMKVSGIPMHIIGKNFEVDKLILEVGVNPTFLLEKDGEIKFAVVNGFVVNLNSDVEDVLRSFTSKGKNAMIYR